MTRFQSLTIYAILIIITGIILVLRGQWLVNSYSNFSLYVNHYPITYSVAFLMLISSAFALYTADKSRNFKPAFKYHGLHAIGMLVYALAVLFFVKDLQVFLNVTTFFLLYYGISEIVFCFQLLVLRQNNINSQTVFFRIVVGFLIALGAILVLAMFYTDPNKALLISGVVFIFSGINLMAFKTVQQRPEKGM